MATLPNGAGVLILVDVAATPTVIGSQRDASFEETMGEIDTSAKDTGGFATFIPGRRAATGSFESIYVPSDAAFAALKTAHRTRAIVTITVSEDAVNVEECTAFVTRLGRGAPDEETATVSIDYRCATAWVAA